MRRFTPGLRPSLCAAALAALLCVPTAGRTATVQGSAADAGQLAGHMHRHHRHDHDGQGMMSFLENMINELMQQDQKLMKDLGKEQRHDGQAGRNGKGKGNGANHAGRQMGRKGKDKDKDKGKGKGKDKDKGAAGWKGHGAGKTGGQVGKGQTGSHQKTGNSGSHRPTAVQRPGARNTSSARR